MCRVLSSTRLCCGILYDTGDMELPIEELCANAKVDLSKTGPEWTGCKVREYVLPDGDTYEMRYPLFCQSCAGRDDRLDKA